MVVEILEARTHVGVRIEARVQALGKVRRQIRTVLEQGREGAPDLTRGLGGGVPRHRVEPGPALVQGES